MWTLPYIYAGFVILGIVNDSLQLYSAIVNKMMWMRYANAYCVENCANVQPFQVGNWLIVASLISRQLRIVPCTFVLIHMRQHIHDHNRTTCRHGRFQAEAGCCYFFTYCNSQIEYKEFDFLLIGLRVSIFYLS